ncbi:hypothetical protein AB0N17_46540, partial [Streptomyces sp. NPDC051133]|uniref:hypothetical protein n=1 Tax=Streptomyces sp. NPDC051133 TaxID=3155521 RepID=UPI003416BB51
MRNDGGVRLVAEDLTDTRSTLTEEALEELIEDGWLETTVAAVRAAVEKLELEGDEATGANAVKLALEAPLK